MTVMITAGTGHLGSYLVHHLVRDRGLQGVVLFDLVPNRKMILDVLDDVTIARGDVRNPNELHAAIRSHDVDGIIHLDGVLGEPATERTAAYVAVQCTGMVNVLEA